MTIEDDDDTEDFGTSIAIAHHMAILDLIAIIRDLDGSPKDRLDQIEDALNALLPPESLEDTDD